jgi:hypothetical protein
MRWQLVAMSSQITRLLQDNERLQAKQARTLDECSGLRGVVAALANVTQSAVLGLANITDIMDELRSGKLVRGELPSSVTVTGYPDAEVLVRTTSALLKRAGHGHSEQAVADATITSTLLDAWNWLKSHSLAQMALFEYYCGGNGRVVKVVCWAVATLCDPVLGLLWAVAYLGRKLQRGVDWVRGKFGGGWLGRVCPCLRGADQPVAPAAPSPVPEASFLAAVGRRMYGAIPSWPLSTTSDAEGGIPLNPCKSYHCISYQYIGFVGAIVDNNYVGL